MKSVAIEVKNAIRQDYNLNAKPRLTIEWNFNRYVGVSADNQPPEDTDGIDVDVFPIESIYGPHRPTRGIVKARIGQARLSGHDASPGNTRYYSGSMSDQYKYWCSPVETDGSGNFPNWTDGLTKVKPHVSYASLISANKIVINWESSWAKPNLYYIDIQETVGGPWVALSGNSWTINSKGQTVLYHQGSDVWNTTKPVDFSGALITNFKTMAGIRVRVNSMTTGQGDLAGNGTLSYCNVIEISARREEDFTSRLISVADNFDMGEKSIIYPMGTITSNTATVVLNNLDGVLSKESASTYLRWLVEPGAIFNLEYVYEVSGVHYPVQQFNMVGGPWMGQRDDTVNISLVDDSDYLKEVKPDPVFYENLPVTQIIWRLLDLVGYNNYAIQTNDLTVSNVIPYFWTDGTKTIWEIFDELSKATQTMIYFDAYGVLQVKLREAGLDETKTPDWTLRGETSGFELADIVSLDQTDELESNYVSVNYQTTQVSDFNNGFPKLDKVWEAEDTVTLRSSNIIAPVSATEKVVVYISPKDAVTWPYQGIIQIEGEFIRYKAKNYQYYVGGVKHKVNVASADEKKKYDALGTTEDQMKNSFTGGLIIDDQSIEDCDPGYPGRGLWSSVRAAHVIDMTGYQGRTWLSTGTNGVPTTNYFYQDKANSAMIIETSARFARWTDLMVVTTGSVFDQGYQRYGSKFTFVAGPKDQRAGMVINSSGGEDGYYIEFRPTKFISAAARKGMNELIVYSRKSNVATILQPPGKPITLSQGIPIEVDVAIGEVNGFHVLDIYVNGVRVHPNITVPTALRVEANGRFGMFVRGQSKISVEYLYGSSRTEYADPDNTNFYDRVTGGYQGGQWDREFVYNYYTGIPRIGRNTTKKTIRYAQQYFDEFGPIAHEVREYDIKFDPSPVLHSQLYMTNDWQAIAPEYRSTPFGAKFVLANTSRENAVINGEDTLSFPDNSVNQVLCVYARVITQAEAAVSVAKNDSQIQRRGRIDTEISSKWIQTEAAAKALGDWITKHWSEAADEQKVEIFGNPMLEIGDVVAVEYAEKAMTTATHKYYIVGIENSFDEGLTTQLTLRRVRGS